jgi:hypothetical protein
LQIRFGRRKRIQFTDKTHPAQGIAAALVGVASVIFLGVLFMLSSRQKGNAGLFVGVLGMLDLAISIAGFVMAVKCYKKEDIYMITPTIGAVLNGLMIISCMLLYVIGSV